MKSKKDIPWTEIKAEYLNGVTPKELAIKYNFDKKELYKKVQNEKWAQELKKIKVNVGNSIQDRIKSLTDLALEKLQGVLSDEKASNSDKISAAKVIVDISGLKKSELNTNGLTATNVIINREAVQIESVN